MLCHFILLHSTKEIWPECHHSLLPLGYLVSIFDFPAYPFLSSGQCQGMCRSSNICLQDAQEASRAHHLLGSSTSSGPFFLYSEPIRNSSHTSVLGEGELNKSLLGRVTFRHECQSFGKWCGTMRVVRASDSSCFPVLDFGLKMICCCLCGSACFLFIFFFPTERHHIEVLFLLFSLSQWV